MMGPEDELTPLDQLSRDIRKVIDDNIRFLEHLQNEEYEPEIEPDDDVPVEEL